MGVRTEKYDEFHDTIDECYEIVVKEMNLSEEQKLDLAASRNGITVTWYCYNEQLKGYLVSCIEKDIKKNYRTYFYALCMAKTNKFPLDYFEKGKFIGRS